MELSKEKSLLLLEEAERMNPGRWVEHSIAVGNIAYILAEATALDPVKAQIMGYIHDIGKRYGPESLHMVTGYEFMKDAGYDLDYANICMVHSYLNNDIECTPGGHPSKELYEYRKEFLKTYQYTLYDEIIMLCDLMCTDHYIGLYKRLDEIYARKGIHDNTLYHRRKTLELKKRIESRLGRSVEKVINSTF